MSLSFVVPPQSEFVGFPKIPRLNREVIITEKIDGSNAAVWISDDMTEIAACSRTKWISPKSDNFGFASWVSQNLGELVKLGSGLHHGEWYGVGIQRGYGLKEKRFALFNTSRWTPESTPGCCQVVPVLWSGNYANMRLTEILDNLRSEGSRMVPGFTKPEGVVVFHTASGMMQKVLLEGDELPKGIVTWREREVVEERA